jgi:L-fucose mutarotase
MLFGPLIHPPLVAALARAGHGSTIHIADGNYPVATGARQDAERIYLNLAPGLLTVTQVLERVVAAVPVEAAAVMTPDDGDVPKSHAEIRELLPTGTRWRAVGRFGFYESCREPDLAVVVATGDQRLYANVLLTVGVVAP